MLPRLSIKPLPNLEEIVVQQLRICWLKMLRQFHVSMAYFASHGRCDVYFTLNEVFDVEASKAMDTRALRWHVQKSLMAASAPSGGREGSQRGQVQLLLHAEQGQSPSGSTWCWMLWRVDKAKDVKSFARLCACLVRNSSGAAACWSRACWEEESNKNSARPVLFVYSRRLKTTTGLYYPKVPLLAY